MNTRKRFFSDYYDSVQQRHLYNPFQENGNFQKLILGRLRLDSLLSKKIVLTDAMVMDGQLFLLLDPYELKEDLQRLDKDNCPIEIKARSESIENALMLFLKNTKDRIIKPFSFSCISDDDQRTYIKNELKKVNYNSINGVNDILDQFRSFGLSGFSSDNFDLIKNGWNKWIKACDENVIRVSAWNGVFDLIGQLGDKNTIISKYSSKSALDSIDYIFQNPYVRTDVESFLINEYNKAEAENVKRELTMITGWYNAMYNCTISNQHQCDNYETIYTTADYLNNPNRKIDISSGINVPEHFIYALGTMPKDKYRSIFYDNQSNFESWWETNNEESLKNGLNPFIEAALKSKGLLAEEKEKLNISVAGAIGAVSGILACTLAGVTVGLATGAIAAAGPLIFQYYQSKKNNKPIANLSQRIIDVVKKREEDN